MMKSAIVCALLCLAFNTARPAAPPRPNIVLILTDDMGYADLGCYGGRFAPTPNLDRLAREGTRFTQYYCPAPICSPSRAGLLTGLYPGRSRITSYLQTREGNRGCEQADWLDPRQPSLARALRQAGYVTGHFGKWHLGGGRDVTNAPSIRQYGFDEFLSTNESPDPDPGLRRNVWQPQPDDPVKRWERTAFFVDAALKFMRRHKDQPLFVNLWPDDVHTPWVPGPQDLPPAAAGSEQRRKFAAVLAEYDRQMGRLLDGLRELGLEQRTLVLFTSDNGALPTLEGARSGQFRGSKLSLYEGGIRMPFIARWPGHTPAGRLESESVLAAVDLFPTLCALAGAALPANVAFDGEDLRPVLLGKPVRRQKPLCWEYGRNDRWFAYPKAPGQRSPNLAVREAQWKLLLNSDGSGVELYDLNADPGEATNLAARHPEIARRLSELVLNWHRSLPAGIKTP